MHQTGPQLTIVCVTERERERERERGGGTRICYTNGSSLSPLFPSINSHVSFLVFLGKFLAGQAASASPLTPSPVNVQDSLPSPRQSSCHNALNQTWGEAGAERSGSPRPPMKPWFNNSYRQHCRETCSAFLSTPVTPQRLTRSVHDHVKL